LRPTILAWRGGFFAPLPMSDAEIQEVSQSFRSRFPRGSVTSLGKSGAIESVFQRLAPGHRYLHLATHSFFAPPALGSPTDADWFPSGGGGGLRVGIRRFAGRQDFGLHPGLLSGLVFAGINGGPQPMGQDDGILTALEVAEMD